MHTQKSKHELPKGIKCIESVLDARKYQYFRESEKDKNAKEHLICLGYTDEQIKNLPAKVRRKFKTLKKLDRMAKIDKKLLTDRQKKKLLRAYGNNIVADRQAAEEFVEEVQKCRLLYPIWGGKVEDFIDKYDLKSDDRIEIVKSLTMDDFVGCSKSVDFDEMENDLLIFRKRNVSLPNGRVADKMTVYVKSDLDITTKSVISAVSFHESEE